MKILYNSLSTIFTGILLICVFNSYAQVTDNPDSIKKYTIDNCVSEFSSDGIIKTSAGYQFWFVDKEFLDGETKTAGAYASFYCPPNIEHGIRNAGNTELKYLAIKKYEIKQ